MAACRVHSAPEFVVSESEFESVLFYPAGIGILRRVVPHDCLRLVAFSTSPHRLEGLRSGRLGACSTADMKKPQVREGTPITNAPGAFETARRSAEAEVLVFVLEVERSLRVTWDVASRTARNQFIQIACPYSEGTRR